MLSLSLVELSTKTVFNPQKEVSNVGKFSAFNYTCGLSSLVIATDVVRKITEVKDVTKAISDGNYGFGAKYTLLYLFDYNHDDESRNFISVYGGALNNESSANINIVTYFSQEMKEHWVNVQFRDKIVCDEEHELNKVSTTLYKLKDKYGVRSLPAMVVIKGNQDGDEDYCVVDFTGYREENMYDNFKYVMKTINDNCEEQFEIVSQKINGSSVARLHNHSQFDLAGFIQDLVNDEKHKIKKSFTQVDLAFDMGISVRNLQNKRNCGSFTKKECCYLAIRFELPIEQLNLLLRTCGHQELGLEGMDKIIRHCLNDKIDVIETDNLLRKKFGDGLLNDAARENANIE